MFNKHLFTLAHNLGCSKFSSDYQKFVKNQWKPFNELQEEQEKQLRHMITFCYENVPYYRDLFKSLKLQPKDIRTTRDLEKLPVLTKDTIKLNWDDFKPANLSRMKYYTNATGGSTGTPFSYRLSKHDRFLSGALLYRGWGYGGFELGDRMVFLAGSSLVCDTKSKLNTLVHETGRNLRKLSSFDMGEEEMREYLQTINSFKPKFIRGYASSIYLISKWIEENDLSIKSPVAVFTTAEKLHPHMRAKISDIFNCDVYDGYGLNDGGISAYECSEHTGLHIDTERSVMEIVDEVGHQIDSGMGQILATSLHNYSMPFLRYQTGDMGDLMNDICSCGRGYPILKEILGRNQEILQTPEGKYIHGNYFNHVFKKVNNVREFQVIQETVNTIVIKIVPEKDFDEKQLDYICDIIKEKSQGWDIGFKFVDSIERTGAGKYRYVINKVKNER